METLSLKWGYLIKYASYDLQIPYHAYHTPVIAAVQMATKISLIVFENFLLHDLDTQFL